MSVNEQFVITDVPRGAPLGFVESLEERFASVGTDAVIAIGGGSVIDTCKAVAFRLGGGQIQGRAGGVHGKKRPHLIAIPTTLSGAEATASMGITIDGEKKVIKDSRIAPAVVASDPEVLRLTPSTLLFRTSMVALAHCVESLYSPEANPFSTALALFAAEALGPVFRRRSGDPLAIAELDRLGTGSTLSGLAVGRIRTCLQHAVCQVLGRFGASHADAHCVMLPDVLTFNYSVTSEAQRRISLALLGEADSTELPSVVRAIRKSLGLPARLRDLGISRDVLLEVAAATAQHPGSLANPVPISSASDLIPLLESAW